MKKKIICEERLDEGLRFFEGGVCGTLRTTDSCGDKRILEIDNMNDIGCHKVGDLNRVIEEAKVVGGVGEMKSNNGTQWYMQDRVHDGDVSISVCSAENPNYVDRQFRIRKLTPRECWRLMDFTDEDFEKAREVCSDSRLYMQAGNSIVVKCLELIFRQMM